MDSVDCATAGVSHIELGSNAMTKSFAGAGYSPTSIGLHWIAAVAVIALFVTHEGDRGSAMYTFHVSGGAVLGVLLIWRVGRRIRRSKPARPEQHVMLNLLADIVYWGLLATIVAVTLTGYFLPWSLGQALNIFDLISIPSPMARSPWVHEFMEKVHDAAGHIIVPLVLLHVLGAIKHAVLDKDGVLQRMLKPDAQGH